MKHIIFSLLIVVLILFCSCRPFEIKEVNNHYVINQTDKQILHILYSNGSNIRVGESKEDTLIFHIPTQCDTTFEWTVSGYIGFRDAPGYLCYNGFYVYNITDTTSVFGKFYDGLSMPEILTYVDEKDFINNKQSVIIFIRNYYLTVNDQLLSLMQKDYSMLERFKEYYQK